MRRMHKAPLVKGGWHSEAVTGGFSLTTNVCGKPESLHRLTAVPLPLTREAYFLRTGKL